MHRAGINVRYLGLVREHAPSYLRMGILNEICSRAIKNRLRAVMRETSKDLRGPFNAQFLERTISFLNLILGHDSDFTAKFFWCEQVKSDITTRYGQTALTEEEQDLEFDLREHINIFRLFKRVQRLSGVILTKQAQNDLKDLKDPSGSFKLVPSDVKKISARVKHMNIISLAEARALAISALKGERDSERLFRLACSKFEVAIRATPDNTESLNLYGNFLIDFARRHSQQSDNLPLYELAFEQFHTSRSFEKLFELTAAMHEVPLRRRLSPAGYDALFNRCYQTLYTEESKEKGNLDFFGKALLEWGHTLVLQARRTNDVDVYKQAGAKFREGLVTQIRPEETAKPIVPVLNKLTDAEIAVFFELTKKHPKLDYIDLGCCFRSRFVTPKLLGLLSGRFTVQGLQLTGNESNPTNLLTGFFKNRTRITTLILSNCGLTDRSLDEIREHCAGSLRKLDISGNKKLTPKGFAHLAKCSKITDLNISHCTGAPAFVGMLYQYFRQLEVLNLSSADIPVPTLNGGLHPCNTLRHLDVSGLSMESLAPLGDCSGLQSINVSRCNKLKSLDLRGAKQLETIRAKDCSDLSGASLRAISDFTKQLKSLDLYGCQLITADDILYVAKSHPTLTSLRVGKSRRLEAPTVADALGELRDLQQLSVSNVKQLEKEIPALFEKGQSFPALQSLNMIGVDLSRSIAHFCDCHQLREVDLSHNRDLDHSSFVKFVNGCPEIRKLKLIGCINLTDDTLEVIGEKLSHLRHLTISEAKTDSRNRKGKQATMKFSDISGLSNLRELQQLQMENCSFVTSTGLCRVLGGCRCLQELNINGCSLVNESILGSLRDCRSLELLAFEGTKISKQDRDAFCTDRSDIQILTSGAGSLWTSFWTTPVLP